MKIESKLTDSFFEMFDNSKSSSKQDKAINDLTKILNNLKNDLKVKNIIIKGDPIIQIQQYSINMAFMFMIVINCCNWHQDKPDEKYVTISQMSMFIHVNLKKFLVEMERSNSSS